MKKLIVIALVFALTVMSVFAQGSGEQAPKGTPENKWVIGISQPTMTHPIRKAANVLIEEWLQDNPNVEIIVTDGQLKADKQIADIEYFVENGFDIIIVAPNEAAALTPTIKKVYESGMPVITFDRNIIGNSYTARVGVDNVDM